MLQGGAKNVVVNSYGCKLLTGTDSKRPEQERKRMCMRARGVLFRARSSYPRNCLSGWKGGGLNGMPSGRNRSPLYVSSARRKGLAACWTRRLHVSVSKNSRFAFRKPLHVSAGESACASSPTATLHSFLTEKRCILFPSTRVHLTLTTCGESSFEEPSHIANGSARALPDQRS
jgi:hypothetical protein